MTEDKHSEIIEKWTALVLESYEVADFFKSRKDRFANPVGSNIAECLPKIFAVLVSGDELHNASLPLDTVVKIRAVQEFKPSQAVSFIYDLKRIVREVAKDKIERESLEALDSRIDHLALMAFDSYTSNRELLHRIRIRELESGTHALTDGTKCSAAIFRKHKRELQQESARTSQPNSLT